VAREVLHNRKIYQVQVSVIEPSDAINAGLAIQTKGRRLARSASLRRQLDLWLVGWVVGWLVGWLTVKAFFDMSYVASS
jgi:hypothetical protein